MVLVLVTLLAYLIFEAETEIYKLKNEIEKINELNLQLKNQLKNQIAEKDREIGELKKKIDELSKNKSAIERRLQDLKQKVQKLTDEKQRLLSRIEQLTYSKSVRYRVVGVNESSGRGEVVEFKVTLRNGGGGTFVNVTKVILSRETQESILKALRVAQKVTGASIQDYDVFVWFINPKKEELVIVGSSAGAAICVAMIAAIQDKDIAQDVLITGTIEEDGSIGRVGEVAKKAEAALEYGAREFLVPKGQKVRIEGLSVREVGDINEAMEHILRSSQKSEDYQELSIIRYSTRILKSIEQYW